MELSLPGANGLGSEKSSYLPRRGPHIASHSVCPSVCLSVCPVIVNIGNVFSAPLASRMYFRHALRAAYRTAISAAQILPQQFGAGTVDVHLYTCFSACRYLALTASVKYLNRSPKTARKNNFVRTKSPKGSKFSKKFLCSCIQDGLSLCTYIAVILRGVKWRQNTAPNF